MAARRQRFVHDQLGAVRVKHGFSWPAFCFGSLWAAVKGLWFPVFPLLLALDLVLWFLSGWSEAQGMTALALSTLIANVVYAWARGRYGNHWLREGLLRRGFQPGQWL